MSIMLDYGKPACAFTEFWNKATIFMPLLLRAHNNIYNFFIYFSKWDI